MGDPYVVPRLIVSQIDMLVFKRHGYYPDDDAGREYVRLIFDHLAQLRFPEREMRDFAAKSLPWLRGAELAGMIDRSRNALLWKSRELGSALNLKDAEREKWHLWHIKPTDKTDEELDARDREKRAARARARRRLRRPTGPMVCPDCTSQEQAVLDLIASKPMTPWFPREIVAQMTKLPSFRGPNGRPRSEASVKRTVNDVIRTLIDEKRSVREIGAKQFRQVILASSDEERTFSQGGRVGALT